MTGCALCCDDSWMQQFTRYLKKNGLLCLNCSDRGEFVKVLFSDWLRLGRKLGSTYELAEPNSENVIAETFPQEANWAILGSHRDSPAFSGLSKTNHLRSKFVDCPR